MNIFSQELEYYEDLAKNVGQNYRSFELQKKSGKFRKIDAPSGILKKAQLEILHFLYQFSPHPAATGFIRGLGVQKGAERHLKSYTIINLDLSDFFSSIKKHRVAKLLHHLLLRHYDIHNIPCEYSEICHLRNLMTTLCTFRDRLPQGACTSPAIANLISINMDEELSDFSMANNIEYTRYADDMSFSSKEVLDYALVGTITNIIKTNGFKVNKAKTAKMTKNKRMMVTGIVVNEKLGIPKYKRKLFRAKLYNLVKNNTPVSFSEMQQLRGYSEWVRTLNNAAGTIFLQQLGRLQVQ